MFILPSCKCVLSRELFGLCETESSAFEKHMKPHCQMHALRTPPFSTLS